MSVTQIIVIVTCLVSIPAFRNEKLKEDLLFWPYEISHKNQFYRFLTCGFIHGDAMHLIFNMVSLYSFGIAIETFLYPVFFNQQTVVLYVFLYVLGIIFSCIPDFFKYRNNFSYRALGASGAVSAVIFSAILLEPTMPLRFFFIPIDIPGWVFGLAFLALSAYMTKKGGDNIGHNAHFWGGIFGLMYTYLASLAFTDVNLLTRFIQKVF